MVRRRRCAATASCFCEEKDLYTAAGGGSWKPPTQNDINFLRISIQAEVLLRCPATHDLSQI